MVVLRCQETGDLHGTKIQKMTKRPPSRFHEKKYYKMVVACDYHIAEANKVVVIPYFDYVQCIYYLFFLQTYWYTMVRPVNNKQREQLQV